MKEGLRLFRKDMERLKIEIKPFSLMVPVYSTATGKDLRSSGNIIEELLQMMFLTSVDWVKVTKNFVSNDLPSQVIDFGPGEASAKLTELNIKGFGSNIITYPKFISADEKDVSIQRPWREYGPAKFVKFTGYNPVFGGGMTPTTMEPDLTIAAANAGFIVELAGGGQVTESIFRERLNEIKGKLEKGRGIIINTLFLDPYLWKLHSDLIPKLKMEGYPIIGVTISAGVPEKDDAVKMIETFNKAGIWCNSFKVGTSEQIEKVLDIADAVACRPRKSGDLGHAPEIPASSARMTVIIQIEGGKAGGHHSWEELKPLVLKNYERIRRRENILLAVGGGISSKEEALKWFEGVWHGIDDIPQMPVDAIFVGTVLMASKEARTNNDVKEFLKRLEGTSDWLKKHEVKSGMTSGESSLGADIYYVENSAAKAARLLEEPSVSKATIIEALKQTSKPFFGDIEKMTYGEVINRMISLMAPGNIAPHIPRFGPWYDISFRDRARKFAQRVSERFGSVKKGFDSLLHPEDCDYFLWLCKLPGKPVNFVPVIDENVKKWFKSDSLWQSHDPRFSADEVFIMPGPVSVGAIKDIDRPVADILKELCGKKYHVTAGRPEHDVSALYEKVWGDTQKETVEVSVTKSAIKKYNASIGEKGKPFILGLDNSLKAPLTMSFVFAWETVLSVILKNVDKELLSKLVQLSFRVENNREGSSYISEGDALTASSFLKAINKSGDGAVLSVESDILGKDVSLKMENRFFIRSMNAMSGTADSHHGNEEKKLSNPKVLFEDKIKGINDTGIYAESSGDKNPIHLDDIVAVRAGFKGKIVHGMWTSAAALSKLCYHLTPKDPSLVTMWESSFEAPLYPSEELSVTSEHVGNIKGGKIVTVSLKNKEGITVLNGKAYVRGGKTAYIFTGQGSQEKGMGMDGYESSPAARDIWERADRLCKGELGFSILKIVRENPKEMFVGREKVFHPKGVLNLTQFTQVALTTLAMAQVAELKEMGAYDEQAVFCGHSLGEYAALSSSGIIPLKEVIKTVYQRGLTMQNFVPRDENGVSPYGMCVVRPNIVKMGHAELEGLVNDIAKKNGGSLEVVNYNIEHEQYSVTGEKRLLKKLTQFLKEKEAHHRSTKASLILLEGIDVPFHSTVLRSGVDAFRETLERMIPKEIEPSLLKDRYIPNLNAEPFQTTVDYVKRMHRLTESPILKGILDESARRSTPTHPSTPLGACLRTILIELLAYQFASPVQWIKTQERLLGHDNVIEIGPKPVLTGMMQRTLLKKGAGTSVKAVHVGEILRS